MFQINATLNPLEHVFFTIQPEEERVIMFAFEEDEEWGLSFHVFFNPISMMTIREPVMSMFAKLLHTDQHGLKLTSSFEFAALIRSSSVKQYKDVLDCDDINFDAFMDCLVAKHTKRIKTNNLTCGGFMFKVNELLSSYILDQVVSSSQTRFCLIVSPDT